jgi:RNA polymerase sigma-70 factor (ECF subfamily)
LSGETNPRRDVSHQREGRQDTTDEDRELVSACQKGNVDAFEDLVRKYQRRMINIAYRMTGDYDEACEAVQETFLSAHRSIRKFRGEAKFSTWLCGICINHARNRIRQARSRSRYEVSVADDPPGGREGEFPPEAEARDLPIVDQLERKELQEKVQQCINSLEGEHREIIVLRDVEGFSYEEIGDILRLPDGTIKSRLFRAREILRNRLKRVLGDY